LPTPSWSTELAASDTTVDHAIFKEHLRVMDEYDRLERGGITYEWQK
jgi:hypothetical protein